MDDGDDDTQALSLVSVREEEKRNLESLLLQVVRSFSFYGCAKRIKRRAESMRIEHTVCVYVCVCTNSTAVHS